MPEEEVLLALELVARFIADRTAASVAEVRFRTEQSMRRIDTSLQLLARLDAQGI